MGKNCFFYIGLFKLGVMVRGGARGGDPKCWTIAGKKR